MINRVEAETLEPVSTFERTINDIKDNHLKTISSAAMNTSDVNMFGNNHEPLSINNSFDSAKLEPETKF